MKYVAGPGSTAVGSELQGSVTYGLTGVCLKVTGDSPRVCHRTNLGTDFDPINALLAPYVVITRLLPILDDTPPLVMLWAAATFLSVIVLIVANLPLYMPKRLYQYRYKAETAHVAAIWCQAPLAALATALVVSFWLEENAFVDAYNHPTVLQGFPDLPLGSAKFNLAVLGNMYHILIAPAIIQILVFISTVFAKELCPSKENESYSDPWTKVATLGTLPTLATHNSDAASV